MKSKNIPIWRSVNGTVIDYGHKSKEFHPSHAEKGAVWRLWAIEVTLQARLYIDCLSKIEKKISHVPLSSVK